jgi:hypothetical protein
MHDASFPTGTITYQKMLGTYQLLIGLIELVETERQNMSPF